MADERKPPQPVSPKSGTGSSAPPNKTVQHSVNIPKNVRISNGIIKMKPSDNVTSVDKL